MDLSPGNQWVEGRLRMFCKGMPAQNNLKIFSENFEMEMAVILSPKLFSIFGIELKVIDFQFSELS